MFDDLFSGESNKSAMQVLESLLDPDNIVMKTDLNISQIEVLTKLKLQSELRIKDNTPEQALQNTLEYYLQLMVSLKRKSRMEIIEAMKEMKEALYSQENLLNMMPSKK